MDNLPEIDKNTIRAMTGELKRMINSGELPEWIDEQLAKLENLNGDFYEYLKIHINEFSKGALIIPHDFESMKLSVVVSFITLLTIIDKAIQKGSNKEEWESSIGKLLDGIEGL